MALVVLVIAEKRLLDLQPLQQFSRSAGVFAGDEVNSLENSQSANRDVFDVADGCGYKVDRAAPRWFLVWHRHSRGNAMERLVLRHPASVTGSMPGSLGVQTSSESHCLHRPHAPGATRADRRHEHLTTPCPLLVWSAGQAAWPSNPPASSNAWPRLSIVCSWKWFVRICIPIGRPFESVPHGTLMPAMPARLPVIV